MKSRNVIIILAAALAVTLAGVIIMTRDDKGGGITDNESGGTGVDNELGAMEAVFKENSVTYLHVDASGNAKGKFVDQMSDSRLADIIRLSVQYLGENETERAQVESLRKSMIKCGMEVEDATCEIEGVTGEGPLITTMKWEISHYAQREENQWSITYEWVDNLAATREVLADIKETWVLVRNAAQNSDLSVSDVSYRMVSQAKIILPKGSQNVRYSMEGQDLITRYGGGTYEESSIGVKRVDGRPYVIENTVSVIVAENKITVTVENLLRDSRPYRISYQKEKPENWGFLDSIDEVRLELKYHEEPEKNYSILDSKGLKHQFSLSEILYCTADKIISIVEGEEYSIQIPSSDGVSSWGRTDWEACWKQIPKEEYVNLARKVLEKWEGGEVQGPIGTSIGWIGVRNLLYTFTRVLDSYEEEGGLPDEVEFVPSLAWDLSLDGEKIPPKIAYYLLPEPKVITETSTAKEVVNEVRKKCQSRDELPKKLLEWTNNEIAYNVYSFGATSEEVLKSKSGKCTDFTNVYLTLLRSAGIPARRVTGWVSYNPNVWSPPENMGYVVGETPEGNPIAGHAWTEVWLPDEGWTPADPTAGRFENLPYDIYLPVRQSWMGVMGAYESVHGPL